MFSINPVPGLRKAGLAICYKNNWSSCPLQENPVLQCLYMNPGQTGIIIYV